MCLLGRRPWDGECVLGREHFRDHEIGRPGSITHCSSRKLGEWWWHSLLSESPVFILRDIWYWIIAANLTINERLFFCLSEVSPNETQNPLTAVIIQLDAMAAIKGFVTHTSIFIPHSETMGMHSKCLVSSAEESYLCEVQSVHCCTHQPRLALSRVVLHSWDPWGVLWHWTTTQGPA